MKINQISLLVTFAFAFAFKVEADGGYTKDCQNSTIVVVNDSISMRSYCKGPSATPQCSILNLNQCYGVDGRVVIPKQG